MTSLDMAGLSLTLVFLDEELERFWVAPVDTPAYRRGAMPAVDRPARTWIYRAEDEDQEVPAASQESQELATRIVAALETLRETAEANEENFGKLDAVAGDGDHGQGMVYGTRGAVEAARAALDRGAGARTVLVRAGSAWSEAAGGTSGALWGAALTAAGGVFDDQETADGARVVAALEAAVDAVQRLGGAEVGDKTMIDAAVPYRAALREAFAGNGDVAAAARAAADAAATAAQQTADITARLGRSRVLGAKSLGTPDPGAVSFSVLVDALATFLENPPQIEA